MAVIGSYSIRFEQQVKQWGRWELVSSAKDADLVLALTVEAKTVEKIPLKSLEEPHVSATGRRVRGSHANGTNPCGP